MGKGWKGSVDRRTALGLGVAGMALGGARSFAQDLADSERIAVGPRSNKRVLFIFLKGGNDGINSVLPMGDRDYARLRPGLAIPSSAALDLGNGWAANHPALRALMEVHEAGELASIHRVGHSEVATSHARARRIVETAVTGDGRVTTGWLGRWLDAAHPGHEGVGISVGVDFQRVLAGRRTRARHVERLPAALAVREAQATGVAPDLFPVDARGLEAAGLPSSSQSSEMNHRLKDSVVLLKDPRARVVGIEFRGWDTHLSQGSEEGPHEQNLSILGNGIRSIRRATLNDIWNDLLVVVVSEFGRSASENTEGGTDHGSGGVVWVAGGAVRGGVYNCDATTWPSGATMRAGAGLAWLTDYRAVLAEVLVRHLGVDELDLDALLPDWSQRHGAEFDYVGFLS